MTVNSRLTEFFLFCFHLVFVISIVNLFQCWWFFIVSVVPTHLKVSLNVVTSISCLKDAGHVLWSKISVGGELVVIVVLDRRLALLALQLCNFLELSPFNSSDIYIIR